MTPEELFDTIADSEPPVGLSPLLEALWYDARGDWETAHSIAQDIHTKEGSLVHAYLHRKEGDLGNAQYWYSRAGARRYAGSLDEERRSIAELLLATR